MPDIYDLTFARLSNTFPMVWCYIFTYIGTFIGKGNTKHEAIDDALRGIQEHRDAIS